MNRKIILLVGTAVAVAAVLALMLGRGSSPQVEADNSSANNDIILCDGATGGGSLNDPLCDNAAATDGDGDGIVELNENPTVITYLKIDPAPSDFDQPFFSAAYTTWTGLTPGLGGASNDGAVVGKNNFSIRSNLSAPAATNVNVLTGQPPVCDADATNPDTVLGDTFILYDADLGTGTDSANKSAGGIAGQIATTDFNQTVRADGKRYADDQEDLLDSQGRKAGAEGGGPNGLFDGIDLMPDELANRIIPEIQATTGAGPLLTRAYGVANVADVAGTEVNQSINYMNFQLPDGRYLAVTTIAYPGAAATQPGNPISNLLSTVLTCPPFETKVYIYGKTLNNTAACTRAGCQGSPNPNIAGGQDGRTADVEGKFTYSTFVPTAANYDGDLAAGSFDTCEEDVSIDTDLLSTGYDEGETAPLDQGDRWDSSCDPWPLKSDNNNNGQQSNTAPVTGNNPNDLQHCSAAYSTVYAKWDCDQDVDGDGTLNTIDNCPISAPDKDVDKDGMENGSGPVAPGTGDCNDGINNDGDGLIDLADPQCLPFIDWQLDSDEDTVGDVCDPDPDVPGDGNGYFTNAHPHGLIVGGVGGDPPGGSGFFHDHDARCSDKFAIPGVELQGAQPCVTLVDSSNDGVPDWDDANSSGTYQIGEQVDPLADSDSDTHTDGCEAVKGTDPLDTASVPGVPAVAGNCDGDAQSDAAEVAQKSDFTVPGVAIATATPTPQPKPAVSALCTHRVNGSNPTVVDIVCDLNDVAFSGDIYDWEVIYNNQDPAWPDPPQTPVNCTETVSGVSNPSGWVGTVIDADGDTIVETAKCKDIVGNDPWVLNQCLDMHVRILGAQTVGSPITIHLTDFGQNNIGEMQSTASASIPPDCGILPTPTATPIPPTCLDRDGDTTCRDADGLDNVPGNGDDDKDDDGCTVTQEALLGANFSDNNWWDILDVPVPANPDPTANGARNRKVDLGDVLGVLFYAFAENEKPPNGNNVDYDSTKGMLAPHILPGGYLEAGVLFDRSSGELPLPGKVDPTGAPNGKVDLGDVLGALAQAFVVNCIGG